MEHVTCNYCDRDDVELVNEGPDLGLGRPGNYRLVRCRHCGLIYQDPRPSPREIIDHYPEQYARYITLDEPASLGQRLSQRHEINRRCQRVNRYHPAPGRLLDVGCATGLFLRGIRELEWQVAGVELSDHAASYARQNFGLDVKTGTLEEAAFASGSFDVVTMWDVIEHVFDPKATLMEVARVLRPGGIIVASTPNPNSVEARLFGPYWIGWERPRHLHLFTTSVMSNFLEDAGFTLLGFESFSGRLSVTLLSLSYALRAKGYPEKRWRPVLELAYNWATRIATWPLYRLIESANKTTTITVFAKNDQRIISD